MDFFQRVKTIVTSRKNVAFLILLSLVIALTQFCAYAAINHQLGKEMLGVWSLLVAATAFGQISSLGLSSSLVRFLPEMSLKKEHAAIRKMVGTVNGTSFLLVLPILVILYFPASYYGKILLDSGQYQVFRPLLILSMASLFLNNLFQVYSYTLDSMQKHYLRASIQIGGWVIFLTLSLLLLPYFKLSGVAWAMLIQNFLQLAAILFLFKKFRLLTRVFPFSIDKPSLKKIYSFGINSQAISIITIFFDPVIKYFITKNTGLPAAGIYEIANKIAVQLRNLLVNANQVIIPRIVIHRSNGTEQAYFKKISSANSLLAVSAGMFTMLVAPVAVYLFSLKSDPLLLQCILILNIGWTFNTITSVHYYACMGRDQIGKLVTNQLIQSAVIVILFFSFQGNAALWLYITVPPLALFCGSIHNSLIIARDIQGAFSWIQYPLLYYFVLTTIAIIIFSHYFLGISPWLTSAAGLIYFALIRKKFRYPERIQIHN